MQRFTGVAAGIVDQWRERASSDATSAGATIAVPASTAAAALVSLPSSRSLGCSIAIGSPGKTGRRWQQVTWQVLCPIQYLSFMTEAAT